ncbi:MAG: hypothetical protein Q4G46_16180, partial [Propionibacteriaceae bacterium]|nr:hypothetical protein [Propionibacteriaceae bacterium]
MKRDGVINAASMDLDPTHPDWILDADWYLERYPDVADFPGTPWEHFATLGDAEGRQPGPQFDPDFYRRCYLPLEGTRPARHYIYEGRPIGLLAQEQPRTAEASRRAMDAALHPARPPILLVGHDAQRAGAPILLLGLARHYRLLGYQPIFILRSSGPLHSDFQVLGPTFVLAEGWHLAGLGAGLPEDIAIIGNTGWSALVMDRLPDTGPRLLLVHEMTDYLRGQELLGPVSRMPRVAVGMPSMVGPLHEALREFSPDGPLPQIDQITPGLQTRPAPRRAVDTVRREIQGLWGDDVTVYLGAGYADHRKGFDRFLAAGAAIVSVQPDARFVWLGEMSAWAQQLADQAIAGGLPLLLPGFRTDAMAWYATAQCYLLTSRQDPGP